MSSSSRPSEGLQKVRSTLRQHGQEHLLRFWDDLSDRQRAELLDDIGQIHFDGLDRLIDHHVRASQPLELPNAIEPAPFLPHRPDIDNVGQYADAVKRGISLIRQNKVAAFTVAGGQGTRLGFDGPKGAFPISPVKDKPLFRLFAEFIRGTNQRYGADLAWYVMTSVQNDADTRAFFEENAFFGMNRDRVRFFQQGLMPVFGQDGRILLAEKHRVALAPDGHGGSLLALRRSGALQQMADEGVEHISYIQVDNPLVRVVDPLFIGLHDMKRSEMSSKTIPKADDFERVGNFVVGDGRVMVIEYSDLPEELAKKRNDAGERLYDAASIAIHVLSRTFVERLTENAASFGLPWHRAVKKTPFVDASGARMTPDQPNAVKLEAFIFDALPYAERPLILQTSRAEEFSPVKNAEGVDSVFTSRRDLSRRAAAWLEGAGYDVPRTPEGEPHGRFEISPLLALDGAHLREVMVQPPEITPGADHYWE